MLCTQITTIQSQVTLSYGGTKDQEPKIKEKVDEILKHNGVKTVKELKDKLQDTLPEDVKKKYEDLIKKYENETVALGDVTDVITCITAVSGATAGGGNSQPFMHKRRCDGSLLSFPQRRPLSSSDPATSYLARVTSYEH